jgi:uncharacterized protein
LDFFAICITFFNLGFFGGFLHCSTMCSPFVIHQISNNLKNQDVEKFSGVSKFINLALLPYHLGRITTYSIIGFLCSLLSTEIFDDDSFFIFSGCILICASVLMLVAVLPKTFFLNKRINNSSLLLIKLINNLPFIYIFKRLFSDLFNNPTSFRGYLIGIILGFLPCGLLYSAFALSFSISTPSLAFLGMLVFGMATFPALFLVGVTGYGFLNYSRVNIKLFARLVILINCTTIYIIGLNLLMK